MNPFIHVTAQPLQGLSLRPAGGEGAALASASTVEQISQFISQYDLVLSTHGISHAAADALEEAAAGKDWECRGSAT
jgi:molybdopterin biosynthesis enzyme